MNKFQQKFPYLFLIKTLSQKTKDISDFYLLDQKINTSLGMMLGQINCSQEHNIPINRKHLQNALKLTGPSVTNLLNKLEIKGSIIRTNRKDDNRNIEITITEDGKKLLTDIDSALKRADTYLTLGMTEKEKKIFLDLLKRSLDNLENFSQREQ